MVLSVVKSLELLGNLGKTWNTTSESEEGNAELCRSCIPLGILRVKTHTAHHPKLLVHQKGHSTAFLGSLRRNSKIFSGRTEAFLRKTRRTDLSKLIQQHKKYINKQ